MERNRFSGFRRIFTVAFLLFLAPAEGEGGQFPKPAGESLSYYTVKLRIQLHTLINQVEMICLSFGFLYKF